ncbi:MAG: hypothetical protein ACRDMX_11625 [Solirubrobacteraceae bacterium]
MANDDDKPQKISIGFRGGPVLSARVTPSELKKLREALPGPDSPAETRWHDLAADDAVIALDLTKVVYVMVDTEAHRVGFGG